MRDLIIWGAVVFAGGSWMYLSHRMNEAVARRHEALLQIKSLCQRDIALLRIAVTRNPHSAEFCMSCFEDARDQYFEKFEAVTLRRMVLEFWKPIDSYYQEMDRP